MEFVGVTSFGADGSMGDEVVRRSDTVHFDVYFLDLVGVLRKEQLQKTTLGHADQGALLGVWMPWAVVLHDGIGVGVLVSLAGCWPIHNVERSRHWQWEPVAANYGLEVILSICVPLSRAVSGFVEMDGKGQEADTTKGVDDGEFGVVGRRPGKMDDGASLHGWREDGAGHGLAQLPRAIFGVGSRALQVDEGAVGRDGRDGAVLGIGDAPTASPAAHLIDSLLQRLAGRLRRDGQDLVAKQIVVHAGHASSKRVQMVVKHHGHLGVCHRW